MTRSHCKTGKACYVKDGDGKQVRAYKTVLHIPEVLHSFLKNNWVYCLEEKDILKTIKTTEETNFKYQVLQ